MHVKMMIKGTIPEEKGQGIIDSNHHFKDQALHKKDFL